MAMENRKENDTFRIEWCERPVVRVHGTVMTRDDNIGGWVPYMNGGQSKVGIHESSDGRRYRIYGWRVNDKKVTLDCLIQRNMVFHETIGTFHHWKVGDKKMGLTFYAPAEARSFNRGVRFALEQLSRVADYRSSSASSTCSRLSDDHHSSCTSPASSTGSSSPCETNTLPHHRSSHEGRKKLSTSSASSSSSRQGNRTRRSPHAKPGRPTRVTHNSTSSSTSAQNRSTNAAHHPPPVVTAAQTLSILSSPRYCETPSGDKNQQHFRWPLPQQQAYQTNLTFLNRSLTKDGSPYELSAFTLPKSNPPAPSPRESDPGNIKTQAGSEEAERDGDEQGKCIDPSLAVHRVRVPPTHRREPVHSRSSRENRRMASPNHARQRSHQHSTRPRHTKTPHLDILERQRDQKPTEQNSYVFFSSSKPTTAIGSQRLGSRTLTTGVTNALSSIRHTGNYKPLGLIDSTYQYHPMLSTMRNCTPYQPPQTGTLSIMASSADTSHFYNRTDLYFTSNVDSIKDDAICYEPRSSLISSPKKSKYHQKGGYFSDSTGDIGRRRHSVDSTCCCCPCLNPTRCRRRTSTLSRHKEDLAERSKCSHCHEMFNHELNKPGSCKVAPDKCLDTINKVSCVFCVHGCFYHCCADDEGEYDDEPCSCTNGRGSGKSKVLRRWTALAALSIVFPCLCLYPPLRACHSCGVACHCCGGKHQAKSSGKQKQPKR